VVKAQLALAVSFSLSDSQCKAIHPSPRTRWAQLQCCPHASYSREAAITLRAKMLGESSKA
jgi:hypothetical protein